MSRLFITTDLENLLKLTYQLIINHDERVLKNTYLYSVNLCKRCICTVFTIFTYKFTHQPSTDGNGRDPWDTIGDPHGYIKNFVTVQMSLRLFCLLPGFVLNDSITQRLSIFHHNLWTKIEIMLITFKKQFSMMMLWITFSSPFYTLKIVNFNF